jgi:hypothetical protein
MCSVKSGDIVFSYYHQRIQHVGVASGTAVTATKPVNFGEPGQWDNEGWQVPVKWRTVPTPFRPREFIQILRPHLPRKYSPLRQDGYGLQGVYLASIPSAMAGAILERLDPEIRGSLRAI